MPAKKSKKPGDRVATCKLMAKGHVRDDCVGEVTISIDDITPTATQSWVSLDRKKGSADLHLETWAEHSGADGARKNSTDGSAAAAAGEGSSASGGASAVPEGVESKYTIGKEIGRGGFSIVYEATSKELLKRKCCPATSRSRTTSSLCCCSARSTS